MEGLGQSTDFCVRCPVPKPLGRSHVDHHTPESWKLASEIYFISLPLITNSCYVQLTDFLQRLITALLFALVLLLPIYLGPLYGACIIGILCFVTVWEYLRIQALTGSRLYINVMIACFMYLSLVVLIHQKGIALPVKYAIVLCLLFELLLIIRLIQRKNPFSFVYQAVPATLYIALPLSLLLAIAQWDGFYRPGVILGILLLVWTNDVMAYLIGRKFGRHLFSPEISPKKTWEGTLGGWISCLLASFVLAQLVEGFTQMQWLLLAGVIAVSGSYGDLIESLFKRRKNIKDSGVFLRGHGGFLDRLDSLLFCLPLVAGIFLLWSLR